MMKEKMYTGFQNLIYNILRMLSKSKQSKKEREGKKVNKTWRNSNVIFFIFFVRLFFCISSWLVENLLIWIWTLFSIDFHNWSLLAHKESNKFLKVLKHKLVIIFLITFQVFLVFSLLMKIFSFTQTNEIEQELNDLGRQKEMITTEFRNIK